MGPQKLKFEVSLRTKLIGREGLEDFWNVPEGAGKHKGWPVGSSEALI